MTADAAIKSSMKFPFCGIFLLNLISNFGHVNYVKIIELNEAPPIWHFFQSANAWQKYVPVMFFIFFY